MELVSNAYVIVPRGWQRLIEKDSVVYVSPDQSGLRSRDEVVRYLNSPMTCKCGLKCPFSFDEHFNFDPKVLSLPDSRPFAGYSDCSLIPSLYVDNRHNKKSVNTIPVKKGVAAPTKTKPSSNPQVKVKSKASVPSHKPTVPGPSGLKVTPQLKHMTIPLNCVSTKKGIHMPSKTIERKQRQQPQAILTAPNGKGGEISYSVVDFQTLIDTLAKSGSISTSSYTSLLSTCNVRDNNKLQLPLPITPSIPTTSIKSSGGVVPPSLSNATPRVCNNSNASVTKTKNEATCTLKPNDNFIETALKITATVNPAYSSITAGRNKTIASSRLPHVIPSVVTPPVPTATTSQSPVTKRDPLLLSELPLPLSLPKSDPLSQLPVPSTQSTMIATVCTASSVSRCTHSPSQSESIPTTTECDKPVCEGVIAGIPSSSSICDRVPSTATTRVSQSEAASRVSTANEITDHSTSTPIDESPRNNDPTHPLSPLLSLATYIPPITTPTTCSPITITTPIISPPLTTMVTPIISSSTIMAPITCSPITITAPKTSPPLTTIATHITSPFATMATPITSLLTAVTTPIINSPTTVTTPITSLSTTVATPIINSSTTVTTPITSLSTAVTTPIINSPTIVTTPITSLSTTVATPIINSLKTVTTPITSLSTAVTTPIINSPTTMTTPITQPMSLPISSNDDISTKQSSPSCTSCTCNTRTTCSLSTATVPPTDDTLPGISPRHRQTVAPLSQICSDSVSNSEKDIQVSTTLSTPDDEASLLSVSMPNDEATHPSVSMANDEATPPSLSIPNDQLPSVPHDEALPPSPSLSTTPPDQLINQAQSMHGNENSSNNNTSLTTIEDMHKKKDQIMEHSSSTNTCDLANQHNNTITPIVTFSAPSVTNMTTSNYDSSANGVKDQPMSHPKQLSDENGAMKTLYKPKRRTAIITSCAAEVYNLRKRKAPYCSSETKRYREDSPSVLDEEDKWEMEAVEDQHGLVGFKINGCVPDGLKEQDTLDMGATPSPPPLSDSNGRIDDKECNRNEKDIDTTDNDICTEKDIDTAKKDIDTAENNIGEDDLDSEYQPLLPSDCSSFEWTPSPVTHSVPEAPPCVEQEDSGKVSSKLVVGRAYRHSRSGGSSVLSESDVRYLQRSICFFNEDSLLVSIPYTSLPNNRVLPCYSPKSFQVGDVVWAKATGLRGWPAKIISNKTWKKRKLSNPPEDKVWVSWYQFQSVSLVEEKGLKPLQNATYYDVSKKKNNKFNKAVKEAFIDLFDRQKNHLQL